MSWPCRRRPRTSRRPRLTVTGITASNKVYDGNTSATARHRLPDAQRGPLERRRGTRRRWCHRHLRHQGRRDRNTVTVAGLTLTGADAGNYVLTPPTTSADITAATLTISGLIANNKTYNGNTSASFDTVGTLAGVAPNDHVTLDTTNLAGTFATKNVGTGQVVTVTGLALAGTDASNYVLTTPAATANITPAILTVNGITASDKVYNANTAADPRPQRPPAPGSGLRRERHAQRWNGHRCLRHQGRGHDKTVTVSWPLARWDRRRQLCLDRPRRRPRTSRPRP